MRQLRLIIIYPQMNASFIRRVVAIAEASNTSIAFFPDFEALKAKYTPAQDATLLVPHDMRSRDVREFSSRNNVRVVTWADSTAARLSTDYQWHCIGDPFLTQNHHSAVSLMTHQNELVQWLDQCKWGSFKQEFCLSQKNATKEFKALIQTLKLKNHPSVAQWQKVIANIMDETVKLPSASLQVLCDGNKLKLHYVLGAISRDVLYEKIDEAKTMQDCIIRFECAADRLTVCCEMQLGFGGQRTSAVILVGCDSDKQAEASKWEDVG